MSLEPYYQEKGITLYEGDCREAMAAMPRESIDTIITDPPYGLEFMGKAWDRAVPGPDFWTPALDVCKPGAMLMAFGGTRLYHRMICAIEDSGWEIRDCLMWLYGSGFPKSHDISKAIDKAVGAEREKIQPGNAPSYQRSIGNTRPWMDDPNHKIDSNIPASPEAEQWNGWGTALKPAWEPIVLAMKSLDGTFAQNALRHGVAGLNIDGGRIGLTEKDAQAMERCNTPGSDCFHKSEGTSYGRPTPSKPLDVTQGRWPANLILDEDTALMLDSQTGELTSGDAPLKRNSDVFRDCYGEFKGNSVCPPGRTSNSGGASRFFYIAKPDAKDRGHREKVEMPLFDTVDKGFRNTHPTVKPTPLMHRLLALQAYLARLTSTPKGGIVLDPFGGSGTTAIACRMVGRECILIEKDRENLDLTIERLKLKGF